MLTIQTFIALIHKAIVPEGVLKQVKLAHETSLKTFTLNYFSNQTKKGKIGTSF